MSFRTLDDLDLDGKKVLVRVDINAPVRDCRVTDDTRLRAIAPTIRDILAKGGKPILLAHFGRPKGKVVPEMSLSVLRDPLSAALDAPVQFAKDCVGADAAQAVSTFSMREGAVLLLENTRFHPGEEANDAAFAAELAKLGDVYCNDAFSAAHRAHASTEALARLLPACAGRLMEAELKALQKALGHPERPVIAVVGGAKVSTKLDLLSNLIGKVDQLVVGGAMANTFLLGMGAEIGASMVEAEMAGTAAEIMAKAEGAGCEIVLPKDVVVAEKLEGGVSTLTVPANAVPAGMMILDAGPDSIVDINARLAAAKTVVWNGPLGVFEVPPFDAATFATAREAARLTREGKLLSVAGGGDTVAALNAAGAAGDFSFISTAGGAFLEWLEGKTLPGVAALEA
jgi:phosphoglycerate kinase